MGILSSVTGGIFNGANDMMNTMEEGMATKNRFQALQQLEQANAQQRSETRSDIYNHGAKHIEDTIAQKTRN